MDEKNPGLIFTFLAWPAGLGWSGVICFDLERFGMIWVSSAGSLVWEARGGNPRRTQKLKILNVNLT